MTNHSRDGQDMILTVDIVLCFLESILALPIVIGNTLTIVAIRRTPRLQTNTNQFVVSLSVADLTLGIGMPFHAAWYVVNALRSSKYVCLIRLFLAFTSAAASILNLLLISIDRYVAVLHPLHYPTLVTPVRVKALIAISWVYALLLGGAVFLTEEWHLETGCAIIYSVSRVYLLTACSIQFSVILGVMFVLYGRILLVAYNHAKKIHAMEQHSTPGTLHCADTEVPTGEGNKGRPTGGAIPPPPKRTISLRELKSTKTLVLVLGGFTLCWAPFFYTCLAAVFHVDIPYLAAQLSLLLGILNSTANPLIYAWRSQEFRKAFKKILGCSDGSTRDIESAVSAAVTLQVNLD